MDRAAPGSLLRSFERHLWAQNRSERTVGNYLESARLAEAFLEGRGKRLEDATQADLEDFLADILRRRSASTAATRYKVLRILYRWLEEEMEERHLARCGSGSGRGQPAADQVYASVTVNSVRRPSLSDSPPKNSAPVTSRARYTVATARQRPRTCAAWPCWSARLLPHRPG
jgi:hypothetical protein